MLCSVRRASYASIKLEIVYSFCGKDKPYKIKYEKMLEHNVAGAVPQVLPVIRHSCKIIKPYRPGNRPYRMSTCRRAKVSFLRVVITYSGSRRQKEGLFMRGNEGKKYLPRQTVNPTIILISPPTSASRTTTWHRFQRHVLLRTIHHADGGGRCRIEPQHQPQIHGVVDALGRVCRGILEDYVRSLTSYETVLNRP